MIKRLKVMIMRRKYDKKRTVKRNTEANCHPMKIVKRLRVIILTGFYFN